MNIVMLQMKAAATVICLLFAGCAGGVKPVSDNNISAAKPTAGAPTSLPAVKSVSSSGNCNVFALLDEYIRFLDEKERAAFFVSLEKNGFRATLTHLLVPASGAYAFSSGGAVYTFSGGRLTEEEWDRYSSEVVLVTFTIRELASRKTTPGISTPAQKLGVPQRSPFLLVDEYVSYLYDDQKQHFLSNIRDNGFDKTLRKLPDPSTAWGARTNGYGAITPKGTFTPSEYAAYVVKATTLTDSIRRYANSVPEPTMAPATHP